jgi:protein O-mannosyl-transferase
MSRRWLIFAPALVVALVFAQTGGFEFLNYDDPRVVTQNPLVQYPNAANLQRIVSAPLFGDYQPVFLLTYAVEWQLSGGEPWLFHLTNVALHALNCVLLVFVFSPFLGRRRAIAAALLFAVHPLVVEPVAWITSRKDTLALPLLLGAVLACRRAFASEGRPRTQWGALSVFLGMLAVLTKTSAVVLPALVLWERVTPPRRKLGVPPRAEWPLILALALPALAGIGFKLAAMKLSGGAELIPPEGLVARADLIAITLGTFLGHALWPGDLHLAYDPSTLATWQHALSWISLLAVPALWLLRKRRAVVFGAGWWLFALLPAAQIVPFPHWAADRYAYLALPGLAALVTALLLPSGQVPSRPRRGIFGAAVVALACLSLAQLPMWRDSRALWSEHVRQNPGNRVALPNLARLVWAEDPEAARALLTEHLRAEPDNYRAALILAQLEAAAGRTQEAEALFEAHGPSLQHATVLLSLGRTQEARIAIDRTLEARPNAWGPLELRGRLALHENAFAAAERDLSLAAQVDPTHPMTWVYLSQARGRSGALQGARDALRRAVEVGLPAPTAEVEQARLDALSGKPNAARARVAALLRLDPEWAQRLEHDAELGALLPGE